MHDKHLQNDTGLETFIQNAIIDPETTKEIIEGITPDLWQQWHENGDEIDPRPTNDHPLIFIIGKLLLRGDDLHLAAQNESKIDMELSGLTKQHQALANNPEEQAKMSRTIRLKRLCLIVDELGLMGRLVRYNRSDGI